MAADYPAPASPVVEDASQGPPIESREVPHQDAPDRGRSFRERHPVLGILTAVFLWPLLSTPLIVMFLDLPTSLVVALVVSCVGSALILRRMGWTWRLAATWSTLATVMPMLLAHIGFFLFYVVCSVSTCTFL